MPALPVMVRPGHIAPERVMMLWLKRMDVTSRSRILHRADIVKVKWASCTLLDTATVLQQKWG